ncbi:MAG: sugar ABC transporter ATP-binding protein [bacterium]|nr:sugar ABC transporter ATP-binding protein [bacterium]
MSGNFILEINGVSKFFPGVQALKSVSFKIRKNTIHALVGENGAGKSTIIKILSGIYKPEEGEIKIDNNPVSFDKPADSLNSGMSTIYQELSVIDDLTIAQDLFFGEEDKFSRGGFINFRKMNQQAKKVLDSLGFNFNVSKKVATLSVSDKQQLEIAKAISKNAKIILMDEPTSALSDKEVENLFKIINKLKDSGVSIIYISHHLDEIFNICDYVTVLRDGMVIDTMPVENTQALKDKVVKEMVGKDLSKIKTNRLKKIESNKIMLELKDYSTSNGVKDVDLQLKYGEVLGIYGTVGSKRTELFKSVFTGQYKTGGKLFINSLLVEKNNSEKSIEDKLGFLPENRKEEGLFSGLPILKNIPFILYKTESRMGFLKQNKGLEVTNQYIELLNIKTPSPSQVVENLSGGNQQKVVLAKLLAANCDILILDEPLVGIDVGTKNELLDIINDLANEGKSIIMISSELPELLRISDRVLIMRNGKIIKEIVENFNQEEIISYAIGGKK